MNIETGKASRSKHKLHNMNIASILLSLWSLSESALAPTSCHDLITSHTVHAVAAWSGRDRGMIYLWYGKYL